jgi:very-short-patch-repair endonuclease/DNA polymerase III delta prime subunit
MSLAPQLLARLEEARRELLDLTARNRLIHTPRRGGRARNIEIRDERSDLVFDRLVRDRKSMSFLAAEVPEPVKEARAIEQPASEPLPPADVEPLAVENQTVGHEEPAQPANTEQSAVPEPASLAQPEDDAPAERHTDSKLQTDLPSDALQKRLLAMYYDARTFAEEQGVNILYLALGFLEWYEEPGAREPRFGPLLLVPVQLERQNAQARFRIRWTEDEIVTNLSLRARLERDFGLELPEIPELDELSAVDYFAAVSQAIAGQPRWKVHADEQTLWFFSFARYLMYRDLDPDQWPDDRRLDEHPLVSGLLGEGFPVEPPLFDEEDSLDELLPVADLHHVVDADSSQALVIESSRRGRNLVVQGPPGTGKSQTIANLIATAVKDGKRVLFVAEKMAALSVVKRRLEGVGLGAMCLELHSHKASKRVVHEELARTLDESRPRVRGLKENVDGLQAARDRLNAHAVALHTSLEPAGSTAFDAISALVRLRAEGASPTKTDLPAAARWTSEEYSRREALVRDVADHAAALGSPATHAWRGVRLQGLLPTDVARLTGRLPPAIERFNKVRTAAGQLGVALGLPAADTGDALDRQIWLAEQWLKAPSLDRKALADEVWRSRRAEIGQLVETGLALANAKQALQGVIAPAAWTADTAKTRRSLAAHGRSWLKLINAEYRKASADLAGLCVDRPPRGLDAQLKLLDQLAEAQQAQRQLAKNRVQADLGSAAFGKRWAGADSDWNALAAIERWEAETAARSSYDDRRQLALHSPNAEALSAAARAARAAAESLRGEFEQLERDYQLDLTTAFGAPQAGGASLSAVVERLESWRTQPEGLSHWTAYHVRWLKLAEQGLGGLAESLRTGEITPAELRPEFEMLRHEALLREALRRFPELAEFSGAAHEQAIAEFCALDERRIAIARREVAAAHMSAVAKAEKELGELAVIRREIEKKRRHLPLRQLLRVAGQAVQAIKPVFMMSPISVAQFLEPGAVEFDLLVIDEASQVRPVDALGALARATQIVVVGDDKQLPPTRFFDLTVDDLDAGPSSDLSAAALESVLGLCAAQNVPSQMLRWHYRSRHHSLIAVSNREFYDGRLFVVPSPDAAGDAAGLRFHYIEGVFDRGGTATNRLEAQAVARAVIDHARAHPELSLGVGAFSVAQRDAILDELERLRRVERDCEAFFAGDKADPFFVKNLENIQGDERDVIFISVGYGPDAACAVSMNFGPLNAEGGQRRLNVLITRARLRCEVFSSLRADQIDLRRSQARGVHALRTFLAFAETGQLGAERVSAEGSTPAFDELVARALRAAGYRVERQTGAAAFFLDLAVFDPAQPERQILGIACDGQSYRAARWARDRDRLRQQVLADRGWQVHRLWCNDWLHRPEMELQRLIKAIEDARRAK